LLADNLSERLPVIWRPCEDKLLRALDFSFLENQPDAAQLLRLIEQESDRLCPWFGSTPTTPVSKLQRKFDRVGLMLRCDLD
jgi:hypothetical protein